MKSFKEFITEVKYSGPRPPEGSRAFKEGWRAAHRGIGAETNPYGYGKDTDWDWNHGHESYHKVHGKKVK